jgi:hypothetical protein
VRRSIAFAAYVVGVVLIMKALVDGFTGDGAVDWFVGVVYALAAWWIAAGIGIRLGVTPRQFAGSVGSALGFNETRETQPKR